MKTRFLFVAALAVAMAACAEQEDAAQKGDRDVTVPERAAVEAAIAAEGCSGGTIKFDQDDREFEVEGTKCADGQFYEIELDEAYKVIEKESNG